MCQVALVGLSALPARCPAAAKRTALRVPSTPSVRVDENYAVVAQVDDLPLTESLRGEYKDMLVRLQLSRERAERLRELAAQATDQVAADERMLRSLGEVLGISPQTTIHDLGGALRGHRLREVAVEVLSKHLDPGNTVHYRDWYELLQRESLVIAGRDPLATFLSQISRSDAVEAVGRRSGRYRLRAVA